MNGWTPMIPERVYLRNLERSACRLMFSGNPIRFSRYWFNVWASALRLRFLAGR